MRERLAAVIAESVFLCLVIAAFVSTLIRSIHAGYLIQPFIYNTFDTHMDWFNTAWWGAHESGAGAYEVWRSVYPPISFVFLQVTTLGHCYIADSGFARDCDWLGLTTIYVTYFIDIIIVAIAYWRWDYVTAPMRTAATAFGLPLLYGLERGNLIIVTFIPFFLAFAPLLRSARLKWLLAACAINFKVYLISTIAVAFTRRRWLAIELILILTVVVYFFSYVIYGKGLPQEIIDNIVTFADEAKTDSWQDVYYSTSLNSMARLFRDNAPILKYVDSDVVDAVLLILPKVVLFGQLSCMAAVFAAWVRPASAPAYRVASIAVCFAIMTTEAGGYCYLLPVSLVFFEQWNGKLRILALVFAYLQCLLTDYVLSYVISNVQFSWVAGHDVLSEFGVALGQFLRPAGLIVMACCLAWATIIDCVRRVRADYPAATGGDARTGGVEPC